MIPLVLRGLGAPIKNLGDYLKMTDNSRATWEALYTQQTDQLAEVHNSTIKLIDELETKNRKLQWDVARLEKEITLKNQEIDMRKQGRGLFMTDVWHGLEQERWLRADVIRYAPEWQLLPFLNVVTKFLVEQNIRNDEQFQAAYQEMRAKSLQAQREQLNNTRPLA